jgi:hypothetical protein
VNEDIIERAAVIIDNSVPQNVDPGFRFVYALWAARALADAGLLVGESDPACGPGKCSLGRCGGLGGYNGPCGGCCGCLGGCLESEGK